ncbi:hypothetical protein N7481_012104 [Penicillium waksmanii]|uniref:uncharacterized protein n=1 Tax=Penicillium waksmanii TaxID=69791 RepID=UPI002546C81F|nr:uncharacterized protein N7481_012104 [Penicillium waksmanii]KAJ5965390.1 hypothetical protein N7481_012104 [Penicillium waksmanii]
MFIAFDSSQSQNGEEGLRNPKRSQAHEKSNAQATSRVNPVAGTKHRNCVHIQNGDSHQGKPPECVGSSNSSIWTKPSSHSENSRTSLKQYRAALERLFPEMPPEEIVNLPRAALLELMNGSGSETSQHHDSPTVAASIHAHNSTLSIGQPVLESLHSMPDDGLGQGLCPSRDGSLEQISDDVNALSLSTRQPASYLGISSTQAALKVITWLLPLSKPNGSTVLPHNRGDQTANPTPSLSTQSGHMPSEGEILDAYFVDFHSLAPLLDEKSFRATHFVGTRKDNQWLALLNIVFALGSIAASGPDNHSHRTYFDRSMNLLNLATLGAPTIETVQTLGLIGGWYCHYISQPNLGYSLIGAAVRMAVSLGLQREPYDSHLALDPTRTAYREYKRRIWWSLCCLETWGHETLGRASMDFFAPTITVAKPRLLDEGNFLEVLPLIENIEFIKVSSKIQEALASMPMITSAEILDLDSKLLQWWENLPPALKDHEPCPESLYTARTVMHWRFHTQRMLLYRPKLLSYAMRRVPFMTLRLEERNAILKCREIAQTAIQAISMATRLNQMIGWNGVWFLFQAIMVPLVCLSTKLRDDDPDALFASCKTQIETAMVTIERMKPYGHTAQRSLEVISSIFEACLVGTGAVEKAPDTTAECFGFQNISQLNDVDPDPPATQDRVLDWTMMSFESLPPQSMWEFLSWGVEDMWPEAPGLGFENQDFSIFQMPVRQG